jgi:hypothetical protein
MKEFKKEEEVNEKEKKKNSNSAFDLLEACKNLEKK